MEELVKLQGEGALTKVIPNMHITFLHGTLKPFPSMLMGKEIPIAITGYASDGKNSGFSVLLPPQLNEYYENPNPPHITVSLGEDGRAVDTGLLHFTPLEKVINITGKLGYCVYHKDPNSKKDSKKKEERSYCWDNSIFNEKAQNESR